MAALESMAGDRLEDYFDMAVWKTSRVLLSDLAVDFDFRGAIPETYHLSQREAA